MGLDSNQLGSRMHRFATRGDLAPLSESLLEYYDSAESDEELYIMYLLAEMLRNRAPEAKVILGEGCLSGKGLVSDNEFARVLLEEAANAGSVRGMYDIGCYYYFEHEYARAIEYFELCVKLGTLADDKQGLCYGALGDSYANLPTPEYAKAIDNLTVAANKYHVFFANSKLGNIYLNMSSPDERRKGLVYLEQAARDGDVSSACSLAELYIFGDKELGVAPDRNMAEQLLSPHAQSDDTTVHFLIAQMSLFGVEGETAGGYKGASQAVGSLEKLWNTSHSLHVADKLALAYFFLGRNEEARELWELADREDCCNYLDLLGRIYVKHLNDKVKGLQYYDRAYRSNTGLLNMFACDEYIELLIEVGRYEEAFGVAVEGLAEYNDVQFAFYQAYLVLSGCYEVADPYTYAQMMEDCAVHAEYTVQAMWALAAYYARNNYSMDARIYLRKLYDCGEKNAAYNLGESYDNEPLLAIDWFTKAFSQGNVQAAVRIAETYEKKMRDSDKAFEWYVRAANAGSSIGRQEAAKFKRTLLGHYKRTV